jgi:hypothetical protein
MARQEIQRLLQRIFVLVVLTVGLTLAVSGLVGNNAKAGVDCDQCLINYDMCYGGCTDSACEQACHTTLVNCYRNCT